MNEQNLIPNSERTPSELKEMTTKGGIASGVARRKKVLLKQLVPNILERRAFSKADLALLESYGMDPNEVTQAGLAIMGLIDAAKGGNVSAFRQLLELTGEEPHLKNEDKKVKIEQEKLKLLKEKGSDTEALDKLDDILSRLGDSS